MESTDISGKNGTANQGPLQSILIRQRGSSIDHEDEFFRTAMRPRANTDPVSPRPTNLHVRFDLPDIVVDDCSDNDDDNMDKSRPDEINKELANTNEGAFFVFTSPPRQRSNTCPMNMFSRRKHVRDRPPTPPPLDRLPEDTFPRHPSWDKVHFSPHSLTSVDEVEQSSGDKKSSTSRIDSRSRKTAAKCVKTSRVKSSTPDAQNSSPKRSVNGVANGHVTAKPNGTRDAIQTSA